jgi:hypothetical protein
MQFEHFKSNVCHSVKSLGDIKFLIKIIQSNQIPELFDKNRLLECFYLLAMVDYLSRENHIPLCEEYDYIRQYKLEKPVYSIGVITQSIVFNSDEPKKKSLQEAIPEFLNFNIIESEVRDVC